MIAGGEQHQMASKYHRYIIPTAVADASGDATQSTTTPVRGRVVAVKVDYSASSAGTTDLTLKDKDGQTILTLTDTNTDGFHYPRTPVQDNAGANVTYDGTNEIYEPYVVHSTLDLTIAQNTENETVDVVVIVEEY